MYVNGGGEEGGEDGGEVVGEVGGGFLTPHDTKYMSLCGRGIRADGIGIGTHGRLGVREGLICLGYGVLFVEQGSSFFLGGSLWSKRRKGPPRHTTPPPLTVGLLTGPRL
jgi:hypothetical protein